MTQPTTHSQQKLQDSTLPQHNPYTDVISQIQLAKANIGKELQVMRKQHGKLKTEVEKLKIQYVKNKQNIPAIQQQQQHTQQQSHHDPSHIADPHIAIKTQLKQLAHSISIKQKQLEKCSLRLQLLSLGTDLGVISHTRLDILQKVFTHYCHYIFKSGRHVTFDRIQYEKSHLIMQRFFAFVHDFRLNKIVDPLKGQRQLVPKHQLILIFKKSSSNSRNLELSQFITCVERFAQVRYDYEESYDVRKEKEQVERKRIKEINVKREKERQKKRVMRQQQEDRERQEEEQRIAQQEQNKRQQQELQQANMQQSNESQQVKEKAQKKEKRKKDKQKKKKKKPEQSQKPQQNQGKTQQLVENNNDENSNVNQTNDDLLKELMKKDASISHPNDELNHLNVSNKNMSKMTNHPKGQTPSHSTLPELLTLTPHQKTQLLYRLLNLDNPTSVHLSLRQYQKPLFKQSAQQRKSLLNSSSISKLKSTQYSHGLGQLKGKIEKRNQQKVKLSQSRSITDQKYGQKKKEDYERYLAKAISGGGNGEEIVERKLAVRKKADVFPLSLNALNQSSDGQLNAIKPGYTLKRYLYPQEEDMIYLKEYGELNKIRSSNSSFLQKSPRLSVDIKKRAGQIQEDEKRQSEQKLERFALQMYKNQHYMKRFMERKL